MKFFKTFSRRRKIFLIITIILWLFCTYKVIAYELLSLEDKFSDALEFNAFSAEEEVASYHLIDEFEDSNYFIIAENKSGMFMFARLKVIKTLLVYTDVALLGHATLSEDNLNDLGHGLYFENIMPINNTEEDCYVGVQ